MSDETKKIIVDDDWKEQARREKERLATEAQAAAQPRDVQPTGFMEIVNLMVMQAMAGLGLLAGPGRERIPPNLEAAKHFIDMLQVLDEKTKGNLTADEKRVLDQVLYEMRMTYVQLASAALPSQGMPGGGGAGRAAPGGAGRVPPGASGAPRA